MQITLNKKSWHFWLYSKVVSDTPPNSLCPYFWSVVAITLFFPVILIIAGIIWMAEKRQEAHWHKENLMSAEQYLEKMRKKDKRAAKRAKIASATGKVFLGLVLLSVVVFLIIVLYQAGVKIGFWALIQNIFTGIGVAATFVFFLWIWIEYEFADKIGGMFSKLYSPLKGKSKYFNPFKWKISIIIWEMIKTIYTKACPLIKWNENVEKTVQEKSSHL